jgi:hypothetical protein
MHVKDFFYTCKGHLKDKGFAAPIIDAAEAAAKKKKEELDREIEIIKKEYEEKMKKAEKKGKEKGKDKKDKKEEEEQEAKKAEAERDEKVFRSTLFSLPLRC